MESAAMVRAARRRAGLSQRQLAAAAAVASSTVVAIESGRYEPSLRVLRALLAIADVELTLDRPVQDLCAHVRRHLRLSLSARLHLALGGSGAPRTPPRLAAWDQLNDLARAGRLHVRGATARGLWLPMTPEDGRPVVEVAPYGPGPLPDTPSLDVRIAPLPSVCTVSVPLVIGSVRTPAPGELALDPPHARWRRSLRAVAAALDAQAATDRANRRSPAHFEPRREEEAWRLLFARRWTPRLRPPDRLDGRGWRLDDDASMDAWIDRRSDRR